MKTNDNTKIALISKDIKYIQTGIGEIKTKVVSIENSLNVTVKKTDDDYKEIKKQTNDYRDTKNRVVGYILGGGLVSSITTLTIQNLIRVVLAQF